MKFVKILLFLFFLLASHNSHSESRDVFNVLKSSWQATDIVLVKRVDGKFLIVERIVGELNEGDSLSLPKLLNIDYTEVMIDATLATPDTNDYQRMLLFLVRKNDVSDGAFYYSYATSIWIQNELCFGFQQWSNPGPLVFGVQYHLKKPLTESVIRSVVADTRKQKRVLASISMEINPKAGAKSLVPFFYSKNYFARWDAFNIAENFGEASLNELRVLLKDNNKLEYHSQWIELFSKLGGAEVLPELCEILKADLLLWKKNVDRLPLKWELFQAGVDRDLVVELKRVYYKDVQILRELYKFEYRDCDDLLKEFGRFWRSHPQLNLKHRMDQISILSEDLLER